MSKKGHNQRSISGFFSKTSKISQKSKQEIHENLAKDKRLHNENENKTQDNSSVCGREGKFLILTRPSWKTKYRPCDRIQYHRYLLIKYQSGSKDT